MFKFWLLIFMIFLGKQGQAQDRFIVFVSEFVSGNLGGAVVRCPGTIITDRHVLTTAACATPTNSSVQLAIDIQIAFPGGGGSIKAPAERAFIHPNYTGDVNLNNVAVVLLEGQFNSTQLPPRTLGSIESNSTCNLFGWGGALDNPETVDVEVYGPQYCNANQPQTYCTELLAPARACEAYTGSPLVCNTRSVEGILLQTGCAEVSPGRFLLPYHSVGEFKDWIEEVITPEEESESKSNRSEISAMLLLSAIIVYLKNWVNIF